MPATTAPSLEEVVTRSRGDIAFFAEHVIKTPLMAYQLDMARSKAKRRIACCGRQIGKTWWVAIEAIHFAATHPQSKVLVVSAGEIAALRLLEICSLLISRSPDLLAPSVVSDYKSKIVFSNGAQIESVPASERQIRSASIDLLIIDEAGMVSNEIWRAAEGTTTARPDARFVITSTPWGGREHWFRQLWQKGMDEPDALTHSWHLPSSVSPFVTAEVLAQRQSEMPASVFAQEYLAEWVEEVGAFFTTDELDDSRVDYQMIDPMAARGDYRVVGGIDYGMAHDANAVVYLAASGDVDLNAAKHGDNPVFWIPAIEQHFRMEYATFIDRLLEHSKRLRVQRLVSESNGVGQMPTQVLVNKARDMPDRIRMVNAVATTAARKNAGFSRLKVLLQQGRLVLPNHPDLLRQLHALTYEQTENGTLKISVPENIGHDDLAMALMQAVSVVNMDTRTADAWPAPLCGGGEILTTARGTRIPTQPSCSPNESIFWGGKGTKV